MTTRDSGSDLSARLRSHLPEIEETTLARIYAIADPKAVADASYSEGLRIAVSVALDYGLAAIDVPAAGPVPSVLLNQARAAARNGVSLDIVLRRYSTGYALLRDFLIEEAQASGLTGSELKSLLNSQAASFDRLLAAVGIEHRRELGRHVGSSGRHHAESVEMLLAGEPVDTAGIPYDFSGHHVGLIIDGATETEAIRGIARALGRRLLAVPRRGDTLWVWLGGRRGFHTQDLYQLLSETEWPARVSLAIGEPGTGLTGWRLTHQQARAALPIAKRGPSPIRRYADVAILSTIVRDDLLVSSLHQMYLVPLETEAQQGQVLRETLRAYFAAEGNVTSRRRPECKEAYRETANSHHRRKDWEAT